MKKTLCIVISLVMLFLTAVPAFANGGALTLSSSGGTDYSIVVSANASEVEKTATNELKKYLDKITSASFEIVDDTAPAREKEIVVGDTNRRDYSTLCPEGADDDAVRILTDNGKLYLTGGKARGALYAVYTFLEDWLGCRWFTHDLTVVPETTELTVPAIDYYYEPCFKLRQTYWMFSTMYSDFCAVHKLHGIMAYLPEEYGGGRYELAVSSVHTMQQFVPKSLFETHPEYFGSDENGNRNPNLQPCLRNNDVFNLALQYALDYFSQNNAILSISQNDGADFCRCEKCRQFISQHGNTDSAAMLDFVNRVAVEVKKVYPEARMETLAYQRTQTPPEGLKVEDNVVIRLCPISTCTLHALDDPSCPPNKKFSGDLSGWSELTDKLYIWDYSTDFQYYYALYPNITTLQGRYQYYRDNNVVSIFDHGCGEVTVPAEFHELRTYLVLKLLWDPDTDIEKHISEFCTAYYGEAGDDIIEFIENFEKSDAGFNIRTFKSCHNGCQDGGISLLNNSSLSSSDVKKLDSIIEKAKSRELTDEQSRAVEGVELSWRFFKNATFTGEFNWFSPFTDPEAATAELVKDMRDYGIVLLAENWSLYFKDEEPDGRMMPTFWYRDEGDLPPDILRDMQFRVFVHGLLKALFSPLQFIMNLF